MSETWREFWWTVSVVIRGLLLAGVFFVVITAIAFAAITLTAVVR